MEDNKLQLAIEFKETLKELRRNYFEWIKYSDISFIEIIALMNIRDHGYLDKRLVMKDYFITNQSINNVINRLLKLQILKLDIERTDGHNKIYALIEKGEEYLNSSIFQVAKIEEAVAKKIASEELKEVIRIYNLINEVIVETNEDFKNISETNI